MLSPNQIEVIKEQAYYCLPSLLPKVGYIYPLPMYNIVKMGTNVYNSRLGLLLLTETDIAKIMKEKTGQEPKIEDIYPLTYLVQSAAHDDMFLLELQAAFSTFIKEDILILPKINAVLVGPPQEKRLITDQNFGDFQDILRIQNRKEIKEAPPENESAIARKFRLKREARDAAKRKQQAKKGEDQTLVELLEIADTFGIDRMNSLYAFYGLVQRNQAREKWNQDVQMICAGADPKKIKTKYWGESLKEK